MIRIKEKQREWYLCQQILLDLESLARFDKKNIKIQIREEGVGNMGIIKNVITLMVIFMIFIVTAITLTVLKLIKEARIGKMEWFQQQFLDQQMGF